MLKTVMVLRLDFSVRLYAVEFLVERGVMLTSQRLEVASCEFLELPITDKC